MSEFKSDTVTLLSPAATVYSKLSNFENLKTLLDKMPAEGIDADKAEMLKQITVTHDTISFPGGPVGNVTLRATERIEPTLIHLEGEHTPMPLSMKLHLTPLGNETQAQVVIDLQIPTMLRPMIAGPVQKMCDQFAQMLIRIPFE